MLNVCTLLWEPNEFSFTFSRAYSEEWVERLYAGFRRNLTMPFNFICYVDRLREMSGDIVQVKLDNPKPTVRDCLQPFEINEPMILVGLDTMVIRNIDHLAEYVLRGDFRTWPMLLPRDPFKKDRRSCNGVCLVPAGHEFVWKRRTNLDDMAEVRRWPHKQIDDVFPGSVVSYKGHVLGQSDIHQAGLARAQPRGLDGVDIVYFHGEPKMQSLRTEKWVKEHWRR